VKHKNVLGLIMDKWGKRQQSGVSQKETQRNRGRTVYGDVGRKRGRKLQRGIHSEGEQVRYRGNKINCKGGKVLT